LSQSLECDTTEVSRADSLSSLGSDALLFDPDFLVGDRNPNLRTPKFDKRNSPFLDEAANKSSAEAALRYQHATLQRDRVLASALDILLAQSLESREWRTIRFSSDSEWAGRGQATTDTIGRLRTFMGTHFGVFLLEMTELSGAGDENRTRVLSLGNWNCRAPRSNWDQCSALWWI